MNNESKIALITGASRGIGHAVLTRLAQEGYIVVGTATSEKGAAAINDYINQNNYQGCGLPLDVTNNQSIETLLSQIKERYGATVEILINNAGITNDNLLMRMKDEEWQSVIDTNLNSIYRMSKSVIKDMMKGRFGRIVSIASVVGVMGNAGQTNYAAAKAGLIGFSKSLAREVGSRGITVNAVAPGFIATDMTKKLPEKQKETLIKSIPTASLGTPEDIAEAVAYLVSARYVTGETIHVNGGMYMI